MWRDLHPNTPSSKSLLPEVSPPPTPRSSDCGLETTRDRGSNMEDRDVRSCWTRGSEEPHLCMWVYCSTRTFYLTSHSLIFRGNCTVSTNAHPSGYSPTPTTSTSRVATTQSLPHSPLGPPSPPHTGPVCTQELLHPLRGPPASGSLTHSGPTLYPEGWR